MAGVYSVGFLVGTFTHVQGILQHGFLAVAERAPLALNLYWDCLALLDPLAALAVWTKPRLGVGLAVLIMFTDVAVNSCAYSSGLWGPPAPGMVPVGLFLQALFATFVFATAPVMRAAQKAKPKP